jgi:hypothetical protein
LVVRTSEREAAEARPIAGMDVAAFFATLDGDCARTCIQTGVRHLPPGALAPLPMDADPRYDHEPD